MAKGKLGSGSRFKAVEKSAAASGARDPAAVAAAVGIKKYGVEKMEKLSQAGRVRHSGSHARVVSENAAFQHSMPAGRK